MSDEIIIRKRSGTWSVRAAGAVIAESKSALSLEESGHPAVTYFPREDIAMAFLDQTEKTSHCPKKGDATYFSIATKNGSLEDVAWSYEAPLASVAKIAGHIAFYDHDLIKIEQL